MSRAAAMLVPGLLPALIVGCTPDQPLVGTEPVITPAVATPADDPIADARSASDAPAEIRARRGLSCGEFDLTTTDDIPASARACFNRSIGTRAAELVVARPTIEGDVVVTFYRSDGARSGYDLVIDSRRDRFSSGGWQRLSCPSAAGLDDGTECAD